MYLLHNNCVSDSQPISHEEVSRRFIRPPMLRLKNKRQQVFPTFVCGQSYALIGWSHDQSLLLGFPFCNQGIHTSGTLCQWLSNGFWFLAQGRSNIGLAQSALANFYILPLPTNFLIFRFIYTCPKTGLAKDKVR